MIFDDPNYLGCNVAYLLYFHRKTENIFMYFLPFLYLYLPLSIFVNMEEKTGLF